MGAPTSNNVLVGICDVYIGTAGSVATNLLGYTQDGVEIAQDRTVERTMMDQGKRAVKVQNTELRETVRLNFGEATLLNMSRAMSGVTYATNSLTIGSTDDGAVSLRIIGKDTAGTYRIWTMPYVQAVGNVSYRYGKGATQIVAAEFEVLGRSGSSPITITDANSLTVTLSTGVATRVADRIFHVIASESGTTDTMTDIDGTSLADDEIVVITPDSGDTITVTHATGVIELTGSADVVLKTTEDRLELQYDLAGTKWVELTRYLA